MAFHSAQELIEEFRQGRMVILVDDEDRENEGDLVMAASCVDAAAINFMARFGRGLICMPMTHDRCAQLGLDLMVRDNRETHATKFTVSVDAAHGITTGISAADRAATVAAATGAHARPSDLVQPGHIFPLICEPGGVLRRAGHTEAGCDLARLAGMEPAAVIVEVLNEDGSMARRPDLEKFAAEHGLKIGTIADLIHYRLRNEKTVVRVSECILPTRHGDFRLVAFRDITDGQVHLALVAGEIDPEQSTLIRVHIQDSLTDLTGSRREEGTWSLPDALDRVTAEGCGVVLILRHNETGDDVARRIEQYALEDRGAEMPGRDDGDDLRTYGLGAQILLDLGVRRMRVMSTPKRMHGISGFGLEVDDYITN